MREARHKDSTIHAAAFGAATLIAGQVAGKAVRDAFFLSRFEVSALPDMVILAALVSIAAGLVTVRLLRSVALTRLVPIAFACSSALLLLEWWIAAWNPGAAAILIYLQMAVTGSLLISGFWSLLGDRFDARSARKQFGRIVAASAFGGVLGGVLAERVGSALGIASVLPILAFLHLVTALVATSLSPERPTVPDQAGGEKRASLSSLTVLGKVPYVRNLALLILFSTLGAGLLDYVFKVRVAAYEDGGQLVRWFALFYASVGVATFLVQLILSRVAIDKLGIAGTVGSLPASLVLGGLGGLVIPGLPMAFAMRGGETMVRGSLFKSGYEMLYAAVPRRERRATKTILDVGVDRFGDVLGAILIGIISWAASSNSDTILLALVTFLGSAGYGISRRLQRGYVQALENSLLSRAMSTPASSNGRTRSFLRTFVWRADRKAEVPAANEVPVANSGLRDPILQTAKQLRSADAEVVRRVLRQPLSSILVSHVVALLAWDEVSADAMAALKKIGPKVTGQLIDALLDPDQEFAIRRRIPRVLAEFDGQRSVDGLTMALTDPRFEVRFHAGQALTQINDRNQNVAMDREAIIRAIEQEFEISPEVWRHHRVLDTAPQTSDGAIAVEHVFRLLALVYPAEPLQIAYRALRSGDDYLRRTSLEYLEQILPLGLWQRILPLVDERTELTAAAS